jgi:glycosyltransferase involved in cell wall biosynthesis
MKRRVSIVVNTYNRGTSLRQTLESFTQLDYPEFEVVVVNGPSTDDTAAVIAGFADRIKVGECANRNLSESRNIGVALAAGDIVAFIDDDAYPDPAWLDRLVEGYEDDEVAAVGGPVYDHTGATLQARYTFGTRLGDARVGIDEANPTELLNTPWTEEFVNTLGTNASFRRDRLISIGGFDEEFEYYLDENSVCWRLIEQGWVVEALDDGYVYHKFLPSDVRNENRATKSRFQVMKSKCFFALKHGLGAHSFYDVCQNLLGFVDGQRNDVRWCVDNGLLTEDDFRQFESDVHAALDAALWAFARGTDRIRTPDWFAARQRPFLPFVTKRLREDKLHICFLTQGYPPGPVNGIARLIHTLATGLAGEGHLVRVLTAGEDHDRVDLEEGVWVHRLVVRDHPPTDWMTVPESLWNYSASALDEILRIHAHRPIDIVEAPNWDSEAVAILRHGGFTTVVGLYTPISTVAVMDSGLAATAPVEAMLEAERFCYRHAHGFRAAEPDVVERIESDYGVVLPRDRIGFIAHGMSDTTAGVRPERVDGAVNVLFVGRLEVRKGIDVVLACIPALLSEFPDVVFTIVGDDTVPGKDGVPFRTAFEKAEASRSDLTRVRFTGLADDATRQRLYAGCDVFVAPSRSESFGLILLEAMMFGKPVIAGDNGGMRSIVIDGGNGFLVPPGNEEALHRAIAALVSSEMLRTQFGACSRQVFEERFSAARMVTKTNHFYDRLLNRVTTSHQPE